MAERVRLLGKKQEKGKNLRQRALYTLRLATSHKENTAEIVDNSREAGYFPCDRYWLNGNVVPVIFKCIFIDGQY